MEKWPLVRLGDLLTQSVERCPVETDKVYPNVGIYGFGRGIFDKPPIDGATTSAPVLYRLRAGQLVYSRLFAFEGAYARVPESADGAYVSNEYPAFDIDTERAVPSYLEWFFRWPDAWQQLAKLTSGMGDRRRRLQPERFLSFQISFPPVREQERIVNKMDAVAARLDDVRRLRQEIQDDANALLVAMSHRNDLSEEIKRAERWRKVRLGEAIQQSFDAAEVLPGEEYPHFGVFSFAKGLFKKAPLAGDEIKAQRLYRASAGQFVYGRLNAYEGAFGIVSADLDGTFVSSEFPIFSCNREVVLPEFLFAYFSSPAVWEHLKRQVTGIGGGAGNRRIRLKESVFLSHLLWLPPLERQQEIKRVSEKLKKTARLQSETAAELDALLPAILDKAFKGEL